MKAKNTIAFLLIIFAIICGYNVYWTIYRLHLDSELADMTPEQRLKWLQNEENYKNYKKAVRNSLALGLDLQGGMFITLEVGVDEVIRRLAQNPNDPDLVAALKEANQLRISRREHYVDLFVEALRKRKPGVRLAAYFAGTQTGLSFNASDEEVIKKLKEEVDGALDRTFNILRTRIDQFGVASPNLQKQADAGRILVELPGVKDVKRVRRILRNTARLEFWPTYTVEEAFPYLQKANERLKVLLGIVQDTTEQDTTAQKDTLATAQHSDTSAAPEGVEALLQPQQPTTAKKEKKDTVLTEEEKREKFKRENPLFAVLLPPDFQRMQSNSPVVGYALISDTAKVNHYLQLPEIRMLMPPDLFFAWTVKPEFEDRRFLTLIALKGDRRRGAPLTGEYIADARADFDPQQQNRPVVYMRMNVEGARIWKKMTTDYLGKAIAIVLDNHVYSYPIVESVIPSGNSQISGNFTIEEAQDLANLLKAGKLPAPTRIVGEEVIGPTLGQDTIRQGMIAFVIAFIVVMLFMLFYYRSSGIIADIALIANLFFILGIASAFNVVLTLPGIAGIVLTMGMAVDANVLIYERIREELEKGKILKSAVNAGFQNALSAIIDGNVTTFLTGLILFSFGTGPIRGFAVMLMIGIITTLVSALFLTRMMLDYVVEKRKQMKISFGTYAVVHFFKRLRFDFVGKRKIYYAILSSIAALFLFSIFTLGFKLSVDFTGGRQFIVELKEDVEVDLTTLRKDLTEAFEGNTPVLKTVGGKNQFMVTTQYLFSVSTADVEQVDAKVKQKLLEGFKKHYAHGNPTIVKATVVGPTIAHDIRRGAVYSIIFSLLGIFFYIFFRFKKWQFGVGALAALTFNVICVLGIFSLLGQVDMPFSVELDQAFIAAILTIVGYAINDTVIVFDRIRENWMESKGVVPLPQLFNESINQTLSRTVVTSVTTLLTVIVLFLFGGEVLKGFLLALFLGITIGTLSTLFVASPISLDLILAREGKQVEKLSTATAPK